MDEASKYNGVPAELPEEVQRWTAKRRAALVLSILKGQTTVQEAARQPEILKWGWRRSLGEESSAAGSRRGARHA